MRFMNDIQRKAAFKRMSVSNMPSMKQMNTDTYLKNMGKDVFGFSKDISSLSKRIGKSGAFDHLKKRAI